MWSGRFRNTFRGLEDYFLNFQMRALGSGTFPNYLKVSRWEGVPLFHSPEPLYI